MISVIMVVWVFLIFCCVVDCLITSVVAVWMLVLEKVECSGLVSPSVMLAVCIGQVASFLLVWVYAVYCLR